MKLSMIPDVPSPIIKCSLGDGANRKWEFEPYDNDGAIDVSGSAGEIFYPITQNGVEMILPEESSSPQTAPFNGTIKYPTEESREYFLTKTSPESGEAQITQMKGETLVWNQLLTNGNFSNGTNGWGVGASYYTASVANNELTLSLIANSSGSKNISHAFTPVVGHKYLFWFDIERDVANSSAAVQFNLCGSIVGLGSVANGVKKRLSGTKTLTSVSYNTIYIYYLSAGSIAQNDGEYVKISNVNVIDLTLLNNIRYDNYTSFHIVFGLDYYDYDSGHLLPFAASGIRTTEDVSFPINTIFPTGMKAVGDVYDEFTPTQTVTRIGVRAYQAGDESDSSVITDMTNTYYVLAEEIVRSFGSFSFVCKGNEYPASVSGDTVIVPCNSDFTDETGWFDCKLAYKQDGVAYSEIIKLYVEAL